MPRPTEAFIEIVRGTVTHLVMTCLPKHPRSYEQGESFALTINGRTERLLVKEPITKIRAKLLLAPL